MSRHSYRTTYDSRPVEVVAGWDRPLQGFFMTVLYLDDTEDYESCPCRYAFNNLDLPVPHPSEFGYFRDALHDLGITLPDDMIASVEADGVMNVGNKIRDWTEQTS